MRDGRRNVSKRNSFIQPVFPPPAQTVEKYNSVRRQKEMEWIESADVLLTSVLKEVKERTCLNLTVTKAGLGSATYKR